MDTATAAASSILARNIPPLQPGSQAQLRTVDLDDKYTAREGSIYLSGIQALVRLPIVQKWRDEATGLKTGGFVSGYRGSPLGGLDEAYWKANKHLAAHDIKFQPGVNEDLALTSVWGTQQVDLIGSTKYDGVFGLWYAKGPGVDRSLDVIKHGNHFGTSKHGGVLMVAGDDHSASSSTVPHQSCHVFSAGMVPVLYPCNVQEYLELGLHGWAMSRFSGCFVGFKALADTVESSASINADPFALQTLLPLDFEMPPGGLNTRLYDLGVGGSARAMEAVMHDYKIYAALAYCRVNRLNRTVVQGKNDRLGIVASGKSYMDVLEALEELGLDERHLNEIGIRLFKVSMPWPLEPDSIRDFAVGLEEILVIEEKRQMVEYQLKEQLYNWREDARPRIVGKFDDKGEWVHPRGEWLLPPKSSFSIAQIARVISARIARFHTSDHIKSRLSFLDAKEAVLEKAASTPIRPAYYCSGCPHNTSTKVPEGSVALAGIGCHIMAATIYGDRTKTTVHMGGEGAPWIGQAHFSDMDHVFANLGDGTYFHSGYLAIRAAQAAKVNITYKILFNDAVAMTGGQPIDGVVTVPMIASQVAAEGIERIAVVTEDLSRYSDRTSLPAKVTIHDRKDLDQIQREFRTLKGVSVIIYDQTCAAEKRRRRKKKEYPDPAKRLFIHETVCEGCGNCGTVSNCVSLLPLETEFGRKRRIDQSNCNKDYSCVKGFCPSFVTVEGGSLRKPEKPKGDASALLENLPTPVSPDSQNTYNILITGIGGTGVITIGALLGMAGHLEGKSVSVLDMTGMSQKNGSVTSHVRISTGSDGVRSQRIATGEADLILGCDMLTTAAEDAISKTQPGRTYAVVNLHQQPPGTFAKDPDWQYPEDELKKLITESTGGNVDFINATSIATALMGDSIASNLFMLGFAFQMGYIPLKAEAIVRAIELNGVAVKANVDAFRWGRAAGCDLKGVTAFAFPAKPVVVHLQKTLEQLISHRVAELTEYQNAEYAQKYLELVNRIQWREQEIRGTKSLPISRAVAKNLYKLMAYKDEYEVARLYSSPDFKRQLSQTFEGDFKIKLNLAPPIFSPRDSEGHLVKREYGPWILGAMSILAKLKALRGTRFDVFGYTEERRKERFLVQEYMQLIEYACSSLDEGNMKIWLDLVNVPEHIRGYGHIKEKSIEEALQKWETLLGQVSAPERAEPLERRMAS